MHRLVYRNCRAAGTKSRASLTIVPSGIPSQGGVSDRQVLHHAEAIPDLERLHDVWRHGI